MQTDLDALDLPVPVQILGVNQVGHESGNGSITSGRDLPWLQETSDALVWGPWEVTYRDVIVVDTDNVVVGVFNLTANNLANADAYDTLRQMFVDAANAAD